MPTTTLTAYEAVLIMTLAHNLRQRRVALGLTQAELAQRMGVSYPRISELENGRGNPSITTVQAAADALETTIDRLLRKPKKTG